MRGRLGLRTYSFFWSSDRGRTLGVLRIQNSVFCNIRANSECGSIKCAIPNPIPIPMSTQKES